MSLAVDIGQQKLAIFDTLNFHFALFSDLQVELREPINLVFLKHDSG